MQIRGHTPEKNVPKIRASVKTRKLFCGLEIDHAEVWPAGLQYVGEHAAVTGRRVGLQAQQRGPRAAIELGLQLVERGGGVLEHIRAERRRPFFDLARVKQEADVGGRAELTPVLVGD